MGNITFIERAVITIIALLIGPFILIQWILTKIGELIWPKNPEDEPTELDGDDVNGVSMIV